MFAQITENKYQEAVEIIDRLKDYSFESILKSELPVFVKSFIINDKNQYFNKEEVLSAADKAIKLQLNYTLRPKWTLVNFVFGGSDSLKHSEILKKLEYFLFYTYYVEAIKHYVNENSDTTVKKYVVESIFDDVNKEIYRKLTVNVTGLKIKNFFLQVFKFIYGEFSEISLNMSVPFSFIKLFLEDKGFTDLLEKFSDTDEFNDNSETELKTVIKILSGKHSHPEHNAIIENTDQNEEKQNTPKETRFKDTVIHKPEKESLETELPIKTELPTEIIEESEEHKSSLRYLYKEDELQNIAKKIFKGDKYKLIAFLNQAVHFLNWREATEKLKGIFIENKVNHYDKTVILFVDVLSDYFNKRED